MAINNPHQIYKQNAVQTASPERLLLMLFEGAIRFMNSAVANLQKRDMENAHNNLVKAQAIFSELTATLDMGYEVSNQLMPLYQYCNRRLMEANIQKQVEPIIEILQLTEDLRKTWEQAIRIAKSGQVTQA